MKKLLIACAILTGCGSGTDVVDGNGAAPENAAAGPDARAAGTVQAGVDTAALTGLYESGPAAKPNQLCMIDKGTGNTQFGLIVWGDNQHSCAGAGSAVRKGDRLTLTMAGDSACAIEATIASGRITLPVTLPDGCSYYCGARARMTGASFSRSGGSAADAMRARDLAGDPLCEGGAG